jgi:hypothetical protein
MVSLSAIVVYGGVKLFKGRSTPKRLARRRR